MSINPEEFPKKYTQHCPDGPKTIEDVIPIYKSPETFKYSEIDKKYAVWAFLSLSKKSPAFSITEFCYRIGPGQNLIEKWVAKYAPEEYMNLAQKRIKKREERLNDQVNEHAIEGMLSSILKAAKKKIRTAGFSQLMVGFGILADKLKTIQAIRSANIHNSENILNKLPPETLEQILKIIEEQEAIQNADYKVVEPQAIESQPEENEQDTPESEQN